MIAPINSAFANGLMLHMSHTDMSQETHIVKSMDTNHHNSVAENIHDHDQSQNADDNSCQTECANCVYCSASNVTTSYYSFVFQNTSKHEELKSLLKSVAISVDIRPPINV